MFPCHLALAGSATETLKQKEVKRDLGRERRSAQEKEGICVCARRRVCVFVCVCVMGGRHALAGFSITQLPLIFNCFLRLAHSSTFHSVSKKKEEGLPSRGEGKEER